MMVCGRLARRIAWVMFWKFMVTRDTLFTFPRPRFQLFDHLVNFMLEWSVRRGGASLQRFNVGTQEFPIFANTQYK